MTRRYVGALGWSLRHRWAVVLATVLTFLSTPALFLAVGTDFVPKDDQSEFEVAITMPEGFSLDRSDALCREIEGKLRAVRGVTNVFTTIGETNGRSPKGQGDVTKVTIYCRMTDLRQRDFTQRDAMADARRLMADYPDLRTNVQEVPLFSSSAFKNVQLELSLRGPDRARLQELASAVVKRMEASPHFTDVDTNAASRNPELQVRID
ncbi:MAG TPA: efflux RND transporter permease subunit, partial [Fimbriiglobus sp.]|nr:efflux RND transporter permease subunit [Fimbriiglobus sp.]